jgi:Ser/Thr protein kinase RdoA (MazF antagonist)
LHAFLRSTPTGPERAQADWAARWSSLEALAWTARLQGPLAQRLARFLSRRVEVQGLLSDGAQPVHDDLHPGNVLFGRDGDVLAFLDFEEALHSHGSTWIDLAWIIERFCLLGPAPARADLLARSFLDAYCQAGGRPSGAAGVLADALLWRNYRALAVLAAQPEPSTPARHAEWSKFCGILDCLDGWRPLLARLEAGVRAA